jgi:putative cell wall-binding protein
LNYQRKRVAKRLASGLLAGALALGGLAISGGTASAKTFTAASGTVVRVAGGDRYATAAKVADGYVAAITAATWTGDIVVVSGLDNNAADALSAIQLAKLEGAPILLVTPSSVPVSTRDWLIANRAQIQSETAPKVHVVGGTSAVSDDVVTSIVSLLNADLVTPKVTSARHGGDTRYATNKAVNDIATMVTAADKVYVVGGSAVADALSIGAAVYDNGVLVMTDPSSLSAEAAATLAAYALLEAAAGTAPEITIVGGASAVSYAVEEAIVAITGIDYADITRIQGATRYATNLAVEAATSQGTEVAFASGTSFADALVAAPWAGQVNVDIVLMPPSGTTSDYTTLLDAATKYWAIGGTSAVATDQLNGAVAQKAALDNLTTSMTCLEGSNSVTVTFTGVASKSENIAAGVEGTSIKNVTHFTVNGVAASAASANLGAVALGATTGVGKASVAVTSGTLAAGDVVTFAGTVESAALPNRSIAGSSCTVADDNVGPTFAISAAKPDASGEKVFYVQASEPVPYTTTAAGNAMATDGTTSTSFDGSDITIAQGTAAAATTATHAVVTALDAATSPAGAASLFLVQVGTQAGDPVEFTAVALDKGHTITITTGGVKDIAGNANLAMTPVAVVADAVAPTVAAGTATCTGTAQATVTIGGFTLAGSLATTGVALNGFKLNVVDVPNQVIPSVVVDAAAKTVTVSADRYRVTADDVVAWAKSHKVFPATWSFTRDGAAPGSLTPTTATSANTTTGGTQTCVFALPASEVLNQTAGVSASATLNGVAIADASIAEVIGDDGASLKVTISGLTAGGSFVITWGAEDTAGNAGSNSLAITA